MIEHERWDYQLTLAFCRTGTLVPGSHRGRSRFSASVFHYTHCNSRNHRRVWNSHVGPEQEHSKCPSNPVQHRNNLLMWQRKCRNARLFVSNIETSIYKCEIFLADGKHLVRQCQLRKSGPRCAHARNASCSTLP